MDLGTLAPIVAGSIVSVIGAVVSIVTTAQRSRQVHAEVDKSAVEGFNALCEQLQKRIDANDQEIATLREEMTALRAENEALRTRVRDLELENAQLKVQLAELQKKRARKGQGA